jgi:hypothetical protein
VNTRVDAVLANYTLYELTITDVTLVKRDLGRNRVAIPARQVVEHHDRLAAGTQ